MHTNSKMIMRVDSTRENANKPQSHKMQKPIAQAHYNLNNLGLGSEKTISSNHHAIISLTSLGLSQSAQ